MKRLIAIWIVCSLLSLASFGVLIYADRRLGVALPYSLSMSLFAIVAIAPAIFALFEWVRGRRPIVVQAVPAPGPAPAPAAPERPRPRRPRGIEGVVLLDCSAAAPGVRAA
jgi:hypothetical protein